MSEIDLIDLESSFHYSMAAPLIPSPSIHCKITSLINVSDDDNDHENNDNNSNNPFDQELDRVVEYEQSLKDPYERVLEVKSSENSERKVDGTKLGETITRFSDVSRNANDQLISSIEMDFDFLPQSDDEMDENLIELMDTPLPEKAVEASDIGFMDPQSMEKKKEAALLLMRFKKLVGDKDSIAYKALQDLQEYFDVPLDHNTESSDFGSINNVGSSKDQSEDKQCQQQNENAKENGRSKDLINVTYVTKPTCTKLSVPAKLQGKEKAKLTPSKLSNSNLKKSPSLRLPNKSSDVTPLKRSLSMKTKVSPGQINARQSLLSNAAATALRLKPSSDLEKGKPIDAKFKSRVTSRTTSRASLLNPTSKITKVPVTKESLSPFQLRRSSTTLSELKSSNGRNEREIMNETKTLSTAKEPAGPRGLRSAGTLKTTAPVKKLERRAPLTTLVNQYSSAFKSRTSKVLQKGKGKENLV